jgi:hypothetical protein
VISSPYKRKKEGREGGWERKEGKKERRKEGKKEGSKVGRKEGRKGKIWNFSKFIAW